MKNSRLLPKLLIFILVVIVGLAAVYSFLSNSKFHLVGTNPAVSSVSTIAPFLELKFNRNIDAKTVSVSASGNAIKTISTKGQTVTLNLNTLVLNHNYVVTIKSIRSVDGAVVKDKTISFIPKLILYNNLPADQQAAVLKNQAARSPTKNDPILGHLPYGTADFMLEATIAGTPPKVVLEASLLLSAADARSDPDAAAAQYKSEVLAYIRSLGLDPNNYQIEYTTVSPSLY